MAASNGDALSEMEKKVIRQVEYYFGDVNLPRDKFLQEKTREDDGWVSMDTMLNFNRLKQISDDKEAICKALQKSTAGLMEVNEDMTKIRRCPSKPLPDNTKERKDDINSRSVYVKGFPEDITLDTLMEFFEQHGKIDTILMRRNRPDKNFKGSVFVTFSNKEEEDIFLGKDVKYNDTELIKMTKEEYFKKKTEEEKERKKKQSSQNEKKAEVRKEDEEKKIEDQMTKGAVLFMKGMPKETTIEEIKAFFGDFGNVGWVELASGDEKALVRFDDGIAQSVLEKATAAGEGKVVMGENELELRVLEGEEEKDYWRKMYKEIADRKQRIRQNRFQNRKRKFGGKPFRKGNRDGDDGEPAAKTQKADD